MRTAQLAPLAESVPPKLYGGTERVVAWLTDELVALGHEVKLFARHGSPAKGARGASILRSRPLPCGFDTAALAWPPRRSPSHNKSQPPRSPRSTGGPLPVRAGPSG